jgi:hypothetical protein
MEILAVNTFNLVGEDLQENGDRSVKFLLGYIFGNVPVRR